MKVLCEVDENPYKPPEYYADEPMQPEAIHRGTGKKARIVFYIQAFSLVLCIVAGMSETYPWLAWGEWLVLFGYLPLVNLVFPPVILILGHKEGVSPGRLFLAFSLSGLITAASFYAILPLVS